MAPNAGRRVSSTLVLSRRNNSSSTELRNRFGAFSPRPYEVSKSKMAARGAGSRGSESPSPPPPPSHVLDLDDAQSLTSTASSSLCSSSDNGRNNNKVVIKKQLSAGDLVGDPAGKKLIDGGAGAEPAVVTTTRRGKRRRGRKTVGFDLAPEYLRHNSYIVKGYRKPLTLFQCIKRWGYFTGLL